MTGCEMIHCTKFQDGKCAEEQEYTDPATGNACCSRGEGAIPVQPTPNYPALLARCKPWLEWIKGNADILGIYVQKDKLNVLLADLEKATKV